MTIPLIIRIFQYQTNVALLQEEGKRRTVRKPSFNELESTGTTQYTTNICFQFSLFIRCQLHTIRDFRFIIGPYFTIILMLVCIFPFLLFYIIQLSIFPNWRYCYGCLFDVTLFIFFIVMVSLLIILFMTMIYFYRNKSDDLGLWKEIYFIVSFAAIFTIPSLTLHLIDPNGIQQEHGMFLWAWIILPAFLVTTYFQTIYVIRKSQKVNPNRFHINDKKKDVLLQDPGLRKLLQGHMETELTSEILWFLDEVTNWKVGLWNKESRQMKAEYILNHFIKHGSPYEINISGKSYEHVLRCYLNGDITMFDEAEKEQYQLLVTDVIPRFMNSKVFKQYNEKMVSNVLMIRAESCSRM